MVLEVGEGVSEFAPGDHVVTSLSRSAAVPLVQLGMEYICDMGAR